MEQESMIAVGALGAYIGWREILPRYHAWQAQKKAAAEMPPGLVEIRAVASMTADAVSAQVRLFEELSAKVANPDLPESVKANIEAFTALAAGQIKVCEAMTVEVVKLREAVSQFTAAITIKPSELPAPEFNPPQSFMRPDDPEVEQAAVTMEAVLRGLPPEVAEQMGITSDEKKTSLSAVDQF